MTLVEKIQKFLQQKSLNDKAKRKSFIEGSSISKSTISKIINLPRRNPEIKTIIKIADYFNCSIDEVIGRENYLLTPEKHKFNNISLEVINYNLRNFINNKLKSDSINPYKLGIQIGFSANPITEFINNPSKSLSSAVIVALADYFKVSIDEMIGRVSPSNQEPLQTTEPNLTSKKQ